MEAPKAWLYKRMEAFATSKCCHKPRPLVVYEAEEANDIPLKLGVMPILMIKKQGNIRYLVENGVLVNPNLN